MELVEGRDFYEHPQLLVHSFISSIVNSLINFFLHSFTQQTLVRQIMNATPEPFLLSLRSTPVLICDFPRDSQHSWPFLGCPWEFTSSPPPGCVSPVTEE